MLKFEVEFEEGHFTADLCVIAKGDKFIIGRYKTPKDAIEDKERWINSPKDFVRLCMITAGFETKGTDCVTIDTGSLIISHHYTREDDLFLKYNNKSVYKLLYELDHINQSLVYEWVIYDILTYISDNRKVDNR